MKIEEMHLIALSITKSKSKEYSIKGLIKGISKQKKMVLRWEKKSEKSRNNKKNCSL
jgi:hypothetical protein